MAKYLVEGIGFNDGAPFTVYECGSLVEGITSLSKAVCEQPRIGHRLVRVIAVKEPVKS